DRFNPGDESVHAIVLDYALRINSVTVQRSDEAETIADGRGKMTRSAQNADDGNAHGAARHFHSRIKRVARNHSIKSQALGLDGLFDQSGSFQSMMKTRQRLALAQMTR